MIWYEKGNWSVGYAFQLKGSVFPKAVAWSCPSGALAYLVYHVYYIFLEQEVWELSTSVNVLWASFNFFLGFLIVFRTHQAYARYWEGATLLRQARGEWFNATSSLFAFCNPLKERRTDVDRFQHLLVRLMSMLSLVALQTIAEFDDDYFAYIGTEGMDPKQLAFLLSHKDKVGRCEIVKQWVQRSVWEAMYSGVLPIPRAVLPGIFQEISRGSAFISSARNLNDFLFPFPYAQMLTGLLIVHACLTPLLSGLLLNSGIWSLVFTFVSVFAFWGTNYVASELESPFADHANKLPVAAMQVDFNRSLWTLLEKRAQEPPSFAFDKVKHSKWIGALNKSMCAEIRDSKAFKEFSKNLDGAERLSKTNSTGAEVAAHEQDFRSFMKLNTRAPTPFAAAGGRSDVARPKDRTLNDLEQNWVSLNPRPLALPPRHSQPEAEHIGLNHCMANQEQRTHQLEEEVEALHEEERSLASRDLKSRPPIRLDPLQHPTVRIAGSASKSNCPAAVSSKGLEAFHIFFEQTDALKFGAEVVKDGNALKVIRIGDGRVREWNKANPSCQVLPGDRIVEVNTASGDAELLKDACSKTVGLNIKIARHELTDEKNNVQQEFEDSDFLAIPGAALPVS